MKTIIIYLAFCVVCWIFLIWEMKHAPFGWEDKNGWHEGKQNNIEIHKSNLWSE